MLCRLRIMIDSHAEIEFGLPASQATEARRRIGGEAAVPFNTA
jgi:hypothetical protein